MALAVVQQWTGTSGVDDLAVATNSAADAWVIATIAYRVIDGGTPLANLGDTARNWWLLCGVASAAGGAWRVEVWACPRVQYSPEAQVVIYTAVSHIHADDTGSLLVHLAEVSGFVNGFPTLGAVQTGTASAAGSLTISMPSPGANSLLIAAAAFDDASKSASVSAGWTGLTQVSRTGPDLELVPAWRTASGAQSVTWTLASGTANWCGLVVAIKETGTVWPQPNPNWPAVRLQLGQTVGLETPLPRVSWTNETARWEGIKATRGIQYELGRVQAGEATITLQNDDDGVTPSAGGAYDIYSPYQLLAAWGGKVHPVSSGWIESYARRWQTAHHGYVDAGGVDAIATLVQEVPSPVRGEILRHKPWAYWPLDDPAGAPNALNVSGRTSTLLEVARSKYGTANATADFGATVGLLGDSGTGWQQTGLTAADTTTGYALVARGDFPAVSGGITIMGLLSLPTSPPAAWTVFIIRSPSGRPMLKLSLAANTGAPTITVWDKDTGTPTSTAAVANFPQGRSYGWIVRFSRTSWRLDYFLTLNLATTGTCDLGDSFAIMDVGGEADERYNGNSGSGTHSHITIIDRQLTDGESYNWLAGATSGYAFSPENTRMRMQRHLATSGARPPRVLDSTGVSATADTDTSGTLVQRLAASADDQDGLIYADGAGHVRFRSSFRTYRQDIRWTLGENTATGEIPYTTVDFGYDSAYLFTSISITNTELGGDAPQRTYTTVDPDAISRYGARPYSRDAHMWFRTQVTHLTEWLLAQYRKPRQRIASVVVDAARYPAAWPLVLSVEVGDLIAVVRRPLGQAVISVRCRVVQVQHDIARGPGQTRGQVTLTLAAAPPPVLVCGDSRAVLGSATLGWV